MIGCLKQTVMYLPVVCRSTLAVASQIDVYEAKKSIKPIPDKLRFLSLLSNYHGDQDSSVVDNWTALV